MKDNSKTKWKTDGDSIIIPQAKNTQEISSMTKSTDMEGTSSYPEHSTKAIGVAASNMELESWNSVQGMPMKEALLTISSMEKAFTSPPMEISSKDSGKMEWKTAKALSKALTVPFKSASGSMISSKFEQFLNSDMTKKLHMLYSAYLCHLFQNIHFYFI